MTVLLETKGLGKRYGKMWALQGVDLQVEAGEVFGFLGPNGAGKTTFTKCVTGFIRPDRGEVRVAGHDARRDHDAVTRMVGLVPDQYDFYPNLSGRQHLDFYGRLQGLSKSARRRRIDEVLSLVRMHERADSKTKTYSHGMKQRICIAQAMLHEPKLIILDEPTNGLDPKGAYELRQMIRDLAADGTTVFLNSHLLNEVEQVCDRVAILDKGRVVTVDHVRNLSKGLAGGATSVEITFRRPLKKFVAIAEKAGALGASLDGGSLKFGSGDVPKIVAALVAGGAAIESVVPHEPDLEEAFLQLTGGDA